ncbi:MAG: hypothetical protein JWM86_1816 [Thermoleophilia bacterium]|nr:hypothetical protein [Thermoleophilia bacterium]
MPRGRKMTAVATAQAKTPPSARPYVSMADLPDPATVKSEHDAAHAAYWDARRSHENRPATAGFATFFGSAGAMAGIGALVAPSGLRAVGAGLGAALGATVGLALGWGIAAKLDTPYEPEATDGARLEELSGRNWQVSWAEKSGIGHTNTATDLVLEHFGDGTRIELERQEAGSLPADLAADGADTDGDGTLSGREVALGLLDHTRTDRGFTSSIQHDSRAGELQELLYQY